MSEGVYEQPPPAGGEGAGREREMKKPCQCQEPLLPAVAVEMVVVRQHQRRPNSRDNLQDHNRGSSEGEWMRGWGKRENGGGRWKGGGVDT